MDALTSQAFSSDEHLVPASRSWDLPSDRLDRLNYIYSVALISYTSLQILSDPEKTQTTMKLHLRFDMAIVACLSLPTVLAGVVHSRSSSLCRYLPGDSGWPSIQAWSQLNSTVQGRLIATVPLGSPCHDPTYNATECAVLSANWALPQYQ